MRTKCPLSLPIILACLALAVLQANNREAYEFLRAQGIDVFFDDTGATAYGPHCAYKVTLADPIAKVAPTV